MVPVVYLRPRRILVIAITALIVTGGTTTGLILALGGSSKPDTFNMEGAALIFGFDCDSAGYSDLTAGSQVVAYNSRKDVVGTSALKSPKAETEDESLGDTSCMFEFTVSGVPAGLKRYGVHVGNTNRGIVWYSENEARSGIGLSIGD